MGIKIDKCWGGGLKTTGTRKSQAVVPLLMPQGAHRRTEEVALGPAPRHRAGAEAQPLLESSSPLPGPARSLLWQTPGRVNRWQQVAPEKRQVESVEGSHPAKPPALELLLIADPSGAQRGFSTVASWACSPPHTAPLRGRERGDNLGALLPAQSPARLSQAATRTLPRGTALQTPSRH